MRKKKEEREKEVAEQARGHTRWGRARWQPGGGGKNKKCHLNGNAEVVPVSEPSKNVVPLFEREKKVVPVSDNYPKGRATI